MKPAIQYRRVSTKEQDDRGYSPEVQDTDNQAYAARNGLVIVADFFDDESGMTLERPGFTAALRYMAANDITAIIAHNNDRITRHPLHYAMLRDEWEQNKIELHYSMRGQVSFDFGGQVSEDIYGRFAKEWWKRILELTRAGKRKKVSSGKVIVAQRPPYGYRLENDALVIVEEEARIIRLIFQMYLDGNSMQAIAEHLTGLNIPTHADLHTKTGPRKKSHYGFWHHKTIRQILTNETYRGVWYWGKTRKQKYLDAEGKRKQKTIYIPRDEWISVPVPAIIDDVTWQRVQKKLVTNRERAARNTRHEYLLARRIRCGFCGKGVYAIRRNGDKLYYYCSSHQEKKFPGHHKCGLHYHRADNIEAHVWFWIKFILQDPNYLIQIIEAAFENETNEQVALTAEIERTEAAIAQRETELKRLLRTFAGEEDAADIKAVRDEIKAEIEQLKLTRERLDARAIDQQNSRDITLELSTAYYRFQDGLFRYNNEPFEIRKNWVEALDVTMVLGYQQDNDLARINCEVTRELYELLSIAGKPPRSIPRNLTWTINLKELPAVSLR